MRTSHRLLASAFATLAFPLLLAAQSTTTTQTTAAAPAPLTTSSAPTSAQRDQPFTSFDTASPTVREAVTSATTAAATASASLDEALRLGVVRPATLATSSTPQLPPSVQALPGVVTRAHNAILAESRATRAAALTPRESAITRLRQAQTDAERQRLIEELRVSSTQRLEAQREDARLVRDRIRQLRDQTTINRPSGN